MLTKDLLRYKIQNGQIYPQFVDPSDNKLLAISAQLISVFEESPDKKRSTLLEASKHVIDSTSGTLVVKRGLEKLLLDRTKFDTTPNEGLIAFRQKLFTDTSQLLSQEQFQNYADYQRKVLQIVENESSLPEDGELGDKLYADLPSGQRVLSFRTLSPETRTSPLQHRAGTRVASPLQFPHIKTHRFHDSRTTSVVQIS